MRWGFYRYKANTFGRIRSGQAPSMPWLFDNSDSPLHSTAVATTTNRAASPCGIPLRLIPRGSLVCCVSFFFLDKSVDLRPVRTHGSASPSPGPGSAVPQRLSSQASSAARLMINQRYLSSASAAAAPRTGPRAALRAGVRRCHRPRFTACGACAPARVVESDSSPCPLPRPPVGPLAK